MDLKEAYEKRRQECLSLQRQLKKAEKTIDELSAGTYVDKEKAEHLRTINRLSQEVQHLNNICLDSAMDNYPAYRLLKDRGISAFIDLNSNRGSPKSIPDSIRIDKDGTPICSAGFRMAPNGSDKSNGTLIWRCPFGKERAGFFYLDSELFELSTAFPRLLLKSPLSQTVPPIRQKVIHSLAFYDHLPEIILQQVLPYVTHFPFL